MDRLKIVVKTNWEIFNTILLQMMYNPYFNALWVYVVRIRLFVVGTSRSLIRIHQTGSR